MQTFTDHLALVRSLTNWLHHGNPPAGIEETLLTLVAGNPADAIEQGAEIMYAHYDLLDTDGRHMAGSLFSYADRQQWRIAADGRGKAIMDIVRRDLGETPPQEGWPADADAPEPETRYRAGKLNWKDGAPFDLEASKRKLWEKVKGRRDELEDGAASTPIGPVQTDDRSKIKISGLVQMAQIALSQAQPFSEPFTLADNSVVELTAQQAIGMGIATGKYVSAVHGAARSLRQQIDAATSEAELSAIDVDAAEWPGAQPA